MLTNGRITCFNSVSRPTISRRLFSLRGSFVSYFGRNMLFYPIPQSLGCAPYVARITLARKFINDINHKLKVPGEGLLILRNEYSFNKNLRKL